MDRKVSLISTKYVKVQQGLSNVSPSSVRSIQGQQGQNYVNKVKIMSTRSIQGRERPVKVSYFHNFNKSTDRPTNQQTDKVTYKAPQGS